MSTNINNSLVITGAIGATDIVIDEVINHISLELAGDVTLTFSELVNHGILLLMSKQDGVGGHTLTWPVNVKWPGGVAPTLTTVANSMDTFIFGISGTNLHCHGFELDVK